MKKAELITEVIRLQSLLQNHEENDQIQYLKDELNDYHALNEQNKKEIIRLQKESFATRDLKIIIQNLNVEIEQLRQEESEVQYLKNELKMKLSDAYWAPTKNERGAGRKPKISSMLIADVKQKRNQGFTFKAIAEEMNISVGLAHKAASCQNQ